MRKYKTTWIAWSKDKQQWVPVEVPLWFRGRLRLRAALDRIKDRRRQWRNRWMPVLRRYARPLFSLQRFPGGHWIFGCLNWVAVRDPRKPYLVLHRRPWPGVRFGLRADEIKTIHVPFTLKLGQK